MKQKIKIRSRSWRKIFEGFCLHMHSLNYAADRNGMYQKYALECILWMEENGIRSVEKVHSNDIFNHIEYIKTRPRKRGGGMLAPSTVTHHIFSIRLLFDYCYHSKIIDYTIPYPKFVKPKRTITAILTIEEVGQIFKACENPRDLAILTLLYGCGLRRSEAYWLDSGDVQVHNQVLYVQEGKGRKFRKIPLSNKSINYLRDYERNYRTELLKIKEDQSIEPAYILNNSGCRMTGDWMYKRLKYLVSKTENPALLQKKITPHSLRHSIATHLVELNVDLSWIQAFLGHATPDSTHIYTMSKNKYVSLY
jgi:integrase/recombinase XerD